MLRILSFFYILVCSIFIPKNQMDFDCSSSRSTKELMNQALMNFWQREQSELFWHVSWSRLFVLVGLHVASVTRVGCKLLQTTEHTDMCCSRLSSQKPLDPSISLPLQEKIPFELRSPSSFLSASLHSAQGSSGMLPPFWHLPFKGSSLPCQLEFGFELVNLPTAASQGRLSLSWHLHIRIRILPLLIDMAYD